MAEAHKQPAEAQGRPAEAQERRTDVQDDKALEIFQQQWNLYRKFLEHDYLSNAEACARLRGFLDRDIARPFDFLDLACGDASGVVTALQGTPIASYRGVDLSAPALKHAGHNLADLPCRVDLDEADFVTAMRSLPGRADIVWISLSLHHLDTGGKRALMQEVRNGIKDDGAFLVYEPTQEDGESRAAYLDRFEKVGRRAWTALSAAEFAEAMHHVRTCDLPETASQWATLGREAGFSTAAELYRSPDALFRLYCYR